MRKDRLNAVVADDIGTNEERLIAQNLFKGVGELKKMLAKKLLYVLVLRFLD